MQTPAKEPSFRFCWQREGMASPRKMVVGDRKMENDFPASAGSGNVRKDYNCSINLLIPNFTFFQASASVFHLPDKTYSPFVGKTTCWFISG